MNYANSILSLNATNLNHQTILSPSPRNGISNRVTISSIRYPSSIMDPFIFILRTPVPTVIGTLVITYVFTIRLHLEREKIFIPLERLQ